MSLLGDARLTDEELVGLRESGPGWAKVYTVSAREAAEAQLAKALSVLLVWLGAYDDCKQPSDDCVCVRLRAEMDAAGIKQPKEASHEQV